MGIGAEIALTLCKAKVKVILTARSESKLQAVADQCRLLGGLPIVHAIDLSTKEGSASVIERAITEFGGIDTLVLNHIISTYEDFPARVMKQDLAETLSLVDEMFKINVLSYIYLSSYAMSSLRESSKPRIIAVGSLAGKIGMMRTAPYSSTKMAVFGFFDSLRQDLLASTDENLRKIQITTGVLGSFGTENALETAAMTMKDNAITWHAPSLAARDLLTAGARGYRTTFSPWHQTKILYLLYPWFPETLDALTRFVIMSGEREMTALEL
jgi:short-subunit dehydrogenase